MDITIKYFLPFFLIFTRIAAFMFSCPIFSWKTIPVRTKIALTFLLSIFFALIITPKMSLYNIRFIQASILIANEAIYGLALGLISSCLFFVVRVAGRIAERQMGMTMANIIDPMTGDQGQPLGMLLETLFILMIFAIQGHHIFIMMIGKSFDSFAITLTPGVEVLYMGLIKTCTTMLMLSLRLAAPMLAAFIVLMVVLAILARVAPEMNILFISLPVRVGMGLLLAGIFVPYLNSYLTEFQYFLSKLAPV